MPSRVAAKKASSERDSSSRAAAVRSTPAFEPRDMISSMCSMPVVRTSGAMAGPVATTTRCPRRCQASAMVSMGKVCER